MLSMDEDSAHAYFAPYGYAYGGLPHGFHNVATPSATYGVSQIHLNELAENKDLALTQQQKERLSEMLSMDEYAPFGYGYGHRDFLYQPGLKARAISQIHLNELAE